MFRFRIDARSGVPTYRQLVDQVRHALMLGYLRADDQLPTVREVAADLAINPNTVAKAYRELEHSGLAVPRAGVGTFVTDVASNTPDVDYVRLRSTLRRWVRDATASGLSLEQIAALFTDALNTAETGSGAA